MTRPHPHNLRKIWRLYQILGKGKLETDGVIARTGMVTREEFSELVRLVPVRAKTPMGKQAKWMREISSLGLSEFAQVIREMFNGRQ